MNIKDFIKSEPVSVFKYYRKGNLYYQAGGFIFRVPIDDTGDGTFSNTMRTMELMRWVRLEMELQEQFGN